MHKAQLLKQYSRNRELTEKDYNNKFFHAVANYKRSNKNITKLKISGEQVSGKHKLIEAIRNYFKDLFA